MAASVLFDAPGPATRARHRDYTVVSALVLLALAAFVVHRFNVTGQFDYDKWEVFITPKYVVALLVDGLLETLKMAFFAILGAVALGFLLGVGKMSDHRLVRWPSWLIVEFFRALPVLMLMIFLFYAVFDARGFPAVVFALMLYNGAVLAEVLRAGIQAVPKGQAEAAYALGMCKSQVMSVVLLPQAVKIMIPAIISQCIVALKDTSLGYIVVAPGLTRIGKMIFQQFSNIVPTVIVVSSMYVVVNLALMFLANWLQRRYVGEKKVLQVGAVGAMAQKP